MKVSSNVSSPTQATTVQKQAPAPSEQEKELTPYERWSNFMDVVAFPEKHLPECEMPECSVPEIPSNLPQEDRDALLIAFNETLGCGMTPMPEKREDTIVDETNTVETKKAKRKMRFLRKSKA